MANGPRYSVPFRRRREGRTDYKSRLGLVRSGKHRAVVRISNMYVYVQIVESRPSGDGVLASASSRELAGLGWKAGAKNLPAAYLTGILAGRRAVAKGLKEVILDMGLRSSTKGSRVYAGMKGLIDGGLQIPHSEKVLPSSDRLAGAHIASYAKSLLSESGDSYKKRFSGYLTKSLKPEDLDGNFEKVKDQIQSLKAELQS